MLARNYRARDWYGNEVDVFFIISVDNSDGQSSCRTWFWRAEVVRILADPLQVLRNVGTQALKILGPGYPSSMSCRITWVCSATVCSMTAFAITSL
jgi:hypothetical protein